MDKNVEQTLGERVRAARAARQITLRSFASRLSISPSHLSNIEHDRVVPEPEVIRRIALSLEEDEHELFALAGRLMPDAVRTLVATARVDPKFFRSMIERLGGVR